MSELTCFLIGPSGAGKTTVGRMLANFLNIKFVDANLEIENLTGKNTVDLCKEKGQEEFQKLETNLLNKFTPKNDIILAASANSIVSLENRNLFNSKGKTIYLAANPINQYTRIMLSGKQTSFLLEYDNKLQYLMDLLKKMEPLYSSVADFVVTTDNCEVEEIVNKIIDYLHCRTYCV